MMTQHISPLVDPAELLAWMPGQSFMLIDASAGAASKERYAQQHLDKALYVDLDKQLADVKPDAAMGGRHPLPAPARFAATLGALGIAPQQHVIIYDDKQGSNAAARFWWMLRAAGHTKVQVLNGGFQAALETGYPANDKIETATKIEPYPFEKWLLPVATMNEAGEAAAQNDSIVIDVRDADRYAGRKEPIDLVAGHIPGAINIPFSSNLDEHGSFLPANELAEKYSKATGHLDPNNIIVHCGSGVTACHTALAFDHAGLQIPKLYIGSWSEWSRNDRLIATEA